MKRIALIVLMAAAATAVAQVRVPLVVEEFGGTGRAGIPVTSGVPLLPGQVKDLSKLVLLDAKGEPVLAQFRPLATWWQADGSLRWVLVDFRADPPAFGTRTYVLADQGGAPAESPLKVATTDDAIVVTTGPAQYTINRKHFNLFDRCRLDISGDGQFSDDEEAISPNPDHGSVVTDTYGVKYFSSEGTSDVHVEEAGPVRVCVVAKGTHRARGGAGYSLGMYGFEVRMNFFVGLNLVKLDALITNNGARPNGSPTFEDFSIVTKVNVPVASAEDNGRFYKKWGAFSRFYGVAPYIQNIPAGTSRLLYQDSDGSENWEIHNGMGTRERTASFRGYRLIDRTPDGEKVITQGDHARGVAGFQGEQFGMVVVPQYFWQQFPKAVELSGDGAVRVGILPAEYKAVHWIEDASAAGQVILLNPYARYQKGQWARDMSGKSEWQGYQQRGPWPHVIDDSMSGPLFARCTPAHYAACGALADVGPYLPIEPKRPEGAGGIDEVEMSWKIVTPARDFPLEVTERRYFMTDYLKGNAYGWQVFGTRWEEFAGHSPWNYEPIGSSYYLFDYINTGAWRTFVYGLRRDRHTRDVRAYKIDGTDVFGQRTYANFRANNVAEDYASRRGLWPKGEEVERYSQGRYGRSGWFLPNPAHCNLDELYDLYCLFGDQRAKEGMRNIAAYGGVWVGGADRKVVPHRDSGWCFRSLLRYYELTGDKDSENYLKPALDHFWEFARSRRSDIMIAYDNNWFFDVWTRSIVMGAKITGDERLRDLAIGACAGRDTAKSTWPTLNAYCWQQTGDAKYFSENWPSYARLGGYFTSCAGWMWGQAREDKTPPAAVKDLSAAAADGRVTLTWTAPGDDGDDGTAAVYQVKYDNLPLVEMSDSKDTVNFWAALNCAGEPKPAKAGSKQSFTVAGLPSGTYYFALKTRDELNNQSGLSNVAKAVVP